MTDTVTQDEVVSDDTESLRKQVEDLTADRDKWKAMSRKHEDAAKANAKAVAELDALKNDQQSDSEKTQSAIADLQKRLADSEGARMRAEVAQSAGLSAAQAKRLRGETLEELEADAADLLEAFKATDTAAASDTDNLSKPVEALRPGASSAPPEAIDVAAIVGAVPRGA